MTEPPGQSRRARSGPRRHRELVLSPHRSGSRIGEAILAVYGGAGRLATPFVSLLLARRGIQGKEDAARRGERFGRASHPRPGGPLVWVHAASVGETLATLPLVERLAARGLTLLLTTGTVTAAQIAARRLPATAIHQFAPVDTPGCVRRFLDHWRPSLVLFAESELWPTMLKEVGRRAPLVLINARMSDRSFRVWRAWRPFAAAILSRIELCLAQSEGDADRLRSLGARRVRVSGNLKFDVPPPPADTAALAEMRHALVGRPVFVAASTHPGEEGTVIAAHAELARNGAPLLTILAPRHPARGDAVASEIARAGLATSRRALHEAISRGTDIYLADTIGEMGLWYRLADVAFLGGSLVPHGGQNPIEPAKLKVPVLHGEHVSNFRDIYDALTAADGVMLVRDAASLAATLGLLMSDAQRRERLAGNASACIGRLTGALDRTLGALEPYLPNPGSNHVATASA